MRKYLKFKHCRRIQVNIFPTQKLTPKQQKICSQQRRSKISSFGTLLLLKRLVSLFYGNLSHSQFQYYSNEAQKRKGKFSSVFLCLLEKRLDVALYRLQFAPTLQAAKQLINHKKVFVNNRCITVASYLLNPGDILSIHDTKSYLKQYFSFISSFSEKTFLLENSKKLYLQIPKSDSYKRSFFSKKPLHFEVNYKLLKAIFLYSPQIVYYPFRFQKSLLSQLKRGV